MKVVVWSIPGCPRCKGLKQQLKIKGIDFEENENANDLAEKGFNSAPVLQVDNEFFVGKSIYDWLNKQ